MIVDKEWVHLAFPTLSPAEAKVLLNGLPEPELYALESILLKSTGHGQAARAVRDLARVYSMLIGNLIAQHSRKNGSNNTKLGTHHRRWFIWHVSGGDLSPGRGIGKAVTKHLNKSDALCRNFCFPPGLENKKHRSQLVKDLLKSMRADLLNGKRPYTLSVEDEERHKVWAEFQTMPSPLVRDGGD